MTEIEKLEAGMVFMFNDPEVCERKYKAIERCNKLNAIDIRNTEERNKATEELLGKCGTNPLIMPVFRCDYGKNIRVGNDFLANYNVTILDVAPVTIGNNCMLAPNVIITTVGHPLEPDIRSKQTAICKPITIGDNVWIGAGAIVLPGVSIGSNSVIAAGAVVSRDIPEQSLAIGIPARVVRML